MAECFKPSQSPSPLALRGPMTELQGAVSLRLCQLYEILKKRYSQKPQLSGRHARELHTAYLLGLCS